MYYRGVGVLEDYEEAAKWYEKAAEQGNVEAQFHLGLMRAHGHGIAQNDEEAVKWFRKAAEQGNAEAQYNLGVISGEA
jgi:TPR repeat protein